MGQHRDKYMNIVIGADWAEQPETGEGSFPFYPSLQPALEGCLALARGTSYEQAFHTYVLVQVLPVDALSFPDKSPISPLLRGSMQQPWIPGQRRRDSPAVVQIHGQDIVVDLNFNGVGNLHTYGPLCNTEVIYHHCTNIGITTCT